MYDDPSRGTCALAQTTVTASRRACMHECMCRSLYMPPLSAHLLPQPSMPSHPRPLTHAQSPSLSPALATALSPALSPALATAMSP